MPRSEVLLIAGLPGSGKSPRLARLQMEGWEVFDDYQANAHDDSPSFRAGQRYNELVESLREGRLCAVADMAFCRPLGREEARNNLEDDVPGLVLRWDFFENDSQECAENILKSSRAPEARLAKLAEFSRQYMVPNATFFGHITQDEL